LINYLPTARFAYCHIGGPDVAPCEPPHRRARQPATRTFGQFAVSAGTVGTVREATWTGHRVVPYPVRL